MRKDIMGWRWMLCVGFLILGTVPMQAQEKKDPWISISPLKALPKRDMRKENKKDTISHKGAFVLAGTIEVKGNKRTKKGVVLREIALHPGDTIYLEELDVFLREKERQLINSSLFLSADIRIVDLKDDFLDLEIDVQERQYFLVVPYLSLADRNFNVWWVKHKHKFNRLNIGAKLYDNNFTGNNDRLALGFTLGYTQNLILSYRLPYFDKKMRHGLGVDVLLSRNREVDYRTDSNRQLFYKQDGFLGKAFQLGVNYSYKKQVEKEHRVYLSYRSFEVGDTILDLNPHFFSNENTTQRYFELDYQFIYRGTDIWAYPLHGFNFVGTVSKKGFGLLGDVNETKVALSAAKYWELAPKTFWSTGFSGNIRYPAVQPYFLFQGMGFNGQNLRGLEYYVADGNYFGILTNTLKRQIFAFKVRFRDAPPEVSNIPFRIYVKLFGDLGYNHGTPPVAFHDRLSNKVLYSYGAGVDIVSFYDAVLRVEYSFNQFKENGLFLHFKSTF